MNSKTNVDTMRSLIVTSDFFQATLGSINYGRQELMFPRRLGHHYIKNMNQGLFLLFT